MREGWARRCEDGHPDVMHGAKAMTAIKCEGDSKVLQGLIQAILTNSCLVGLRTLRTLWAVSVCSSSVCGH